MGQVEAQKEWHKMFERGAGAVGVEREVAAVVVVVGAAKRNAEAYTTVFHTMYMSTATVAVREEAAAEVESYWCTKNYFV